MSHSPLIKQGATQEEIAEEALQKTNQAFKKSLENLLENLDV